MMKLFQIRATQSLILLVLSYHIYASIKVKDYSIISLIQAMILVVIFFGIKVLSGPRR